MRRISIRPAARVAVSSGTIVQPRESRADSAREGLETKAECSLPTHELVPAGAGMPSTKRLAHPVRWVLHLMHVMIVRPLGTKAQRRELAQLNDRQLRDAGIDPALAGRGKAVAVDRTTLLHLETLSHD